MPGHVIEDSVQLWTEITARAGMQEHGYDAELVVQVKDTLGLAATDDLPSALAEVPVDKLLHAVLEALQPFSSMLRDLLSLYEWVGATAADDPNLRIRYAFGSNEEDDYSFDLEAFREHEERWIAAVRLAPDFGAGADAYWNLSKAVGDLPLTGHGRDSESSLRSVYVTRGIWPERMPEAPVTGDARFDALLSEVFEVASEVLATSGAMAAGPSELADTFLDREASRAEDSAGRTLAGLHLDHWLAVLDEQARAAASQRWSDRDERERFLRGVENALEAIPKVEVPSQQLIDELLDVLSLPVWRRRYELYSAWLLTLMVEAFGRRNCRFHVDDGVLSFSFAGSHLASVDVAAGQVELWAELRHPYDTPIGKGRKRAVQPDYTLTRPPLNVPTSALLAVEAKQYARASRKNFHDALVDYAGAHVSATVLLANYGPMSPSLLTSPPDRCSAFGYVRPGRDEERTEFVERIRAAVPVLPPVAKVHDRPTEDTGLARGRSLQTVVALHWTAAADLDLHLVARDSGRTTNYESLANLSADDLVRLWNDDVQAPGLEIAEIMAGAGPVDIWVHRFNGNVKFDEVGASVRVRCSEASQGIIINASGGPESADWWHVGVVSADGTWETVNRVSAGGP